MKKIVTLLLALSLSLSFLTGCGQKSEASQADSGVVEIKENLFIAQTNDIYLNTDEYMDKTIKYEGFMDFVTYAGETYVYVVRNGPGCCGNDGTIGFEVTWDKEYPERYDWVEVSGTLEVVQENGWEYLRLKLDTLEVKEERGLETVTM